VFEIGNFILYFAMVIATVWIVNRFWGIFFVRKKSSISFVIVNIIYGIFQMIRQCNKGNIDIIQTILNIFLILIIAVFGYSCAGKRKYFLLLLFYSVWSLLEEFIYFLLKNIPIEQWELNEIGVAISNIIMIILVYVISLISYRRNNEFFPNNFYFYLLLIPLGSIYIAIQEFYSMNSKISSMITISILIIFNVLIFEIYIKINESFACEKEKTVYEQQVDIISYNTLEQRKMMEDFNEEKHNLINELIVLKSEIENSDREKVIKNLNKIIKNFNQVETISNSGNSTVDSIINFKYAIAREYGIEFCLKIFIPDELPIEQSDIGVVLGNAIDNAIEAVKKCKNKEKVIEIIMGVKKEAWVLVIKNPYEHEIKKDRMGRFQTTKEEKHGHGYGLKSIMRIAEEYQGEAIVDVDNSIFTLTLVLNFRDF
jgi:hypothetical protein